MSGYRVYVGPVQPGAITSSPIDVGSPTPVGGVSSAALTLDRTRSWYAEMTAYGPTGESARSNRVTIPSTGETLGSPALQIDFSSSTLGSDPSGFLDASSAFRVAGHSDGNRSYGALAATTGRAVARYIGNYASTWVSYELSGRTMFSGTASQGGVAVRVPDSAMSSYYAFGVDLRGTFSTRQVNKAPLRCASSASTGVSFAREVWYRFKLRYTHPDGHGRLRAKVWRSTEAEPATWQTDCWTDVRVLPGSGVFALYRDSPGSLYWDDLVVRPVLGTLDPLP